MRKSSWSILPIIVMAQAVLAVPLPADEGVNEPVSSYRQNVTDLVLQSEILVNEVYEGLPQLHREFDNYLTKLSDFKSESSNKAALSDDMLKSWFNLLALIKAESYDEATTTENYSMELTTKELSSEQIHYDEKREEESVSEEERTTTEISTAEKSSSVEETATEDHSMELYSEEYYDDKQLIESVSEKERTTTEISTAEESSSVEERNTTEVSTAEESSSVEESTTSESQLDSSSEEEIPMHFEEIESGATTTDESSSEEEIPMRFEEKQSTVTTTEASASKYEITTTTTEPSVTHEDLLFDELLRDEKKKMQMAPKIVFLERQLHDLKYNSMQTTDSGKANTLIYRMIQWDEKYDNETFKEEVLAVSGDKALKDETKSKLLVEHRRLNNLYMQMMKWEQSSGTHFRIQLLEKYLNVFTFDIE